MKVREGEVREDCGALPAKLIAAREGVHLSQSELARRSGLSQPFISRFEAAETGLSLQSLGRVASALSEASNDRWSAREVESFLLGNRMTLPSPIIYGASANRPIY